MTVSGQNPKGQFTEDTKTLVVNAHGALITLAAKVLQGQQLELKSVSNPEKQSCKVVYIGPTVQGQTQVGIEFTKPAPHFWHVAFPPENWTPVADEGAAAKTPAAATKPAVSAGTKPSVTPPAKPVATGTAKPPATPPAKPVATGTAKPPVPAPVKVSKP